MQVTGNSGRDRKALSSPFQFISPVISNPKKGKHDVSVKGHSNGSAMELPHTQLMVSRSNHLPFLQGMQVTMTERVATRRRRKQRAGIAVAGSALEVNVMAE